MARRGYNSRRKKGDHYGRMRGLAITNTNSRRMYVDGTGAEEHEG